MASEQKQVTRLKVQEYEAAKKALAKLKDHQQTTRTWEEAMKKLGDVGSQRVVAITIENGKVTSAKCEPNGKPESPKQQETPKQDVAAKTADPLKAPK